MKGYQVESQTQAFSIAYEWEEKEEFTWTYPTATDNARSNTQIPIRWQASFPSRANASIDFRYIGKQEWISITDTAALSAGYVNWQTPDTLALAQLRVRVDGNEVLSDIFTISTPTEVEAELDCDDIFSISWAPVEYAKGYQLFTLAGNSLIPLQTTQATSLVLKKNEYPSRHYAISPIINDSTLGQRSLTMNMDFQRAGMLYYRFFCGFRWGCGESGIKPR